MQNAEIGSTTGLEADLTIFEISVGKGNFTIFSGFWLFRFPHGTHTNPTKSAIYPHKNAIFMGFLRKNAKNRPPQQQIKKSPNIQNFFLLICWGQNRPL